MMRSHPARPAWSDNQPYFPFLGAVLLGLVFKASHVCAFPLALRFSL